MGDNQNVFGKAVTEGGRTERARTAFNKQNEDGKRGKALAHVRQLKQLSKVEVATLCIFYNATGGDLSYDQENSKHGKVYDFYPTRVQNGQWGVFLHISNPDESNTHDEAGCPCNFGSTGFVVYHGKSNETEIRTQQLAWDNSTNSKNHAYCSISDEGEADDADTVYKKMELSSRQEISREFGLFTRAEIQDGNSPLYEAILSRDDSTQVSALSVDQDVDEASSAT